MRVKLTDEQRVKSRSEAGRKSALTKAKYIKDIEKGSKLQGRLLSRAMAGAKAIALKKEPTLTITGVNNPKFMVLEPSDFDRLEIPDYQRGIQPDEVNEILRALKAGGLVADPVTLARRMWLPELKKLFVVDGQQRTLAHMEAQMPMRAIVYECATPEAERNLFVIMNTNRVVSANNIINAASSRISTLLRSIDSNPEHPCYRRLVMTKGPGSAAKNMGASIVLRGLALALGAVPTSRGLTAQKLLPKMDEVYDLPKADAFMRLLAEITPTGDENRLRLLPSLALGKVFAEKCLQYGRVVCPSRGSISSIRRTNWGKVTGGAYTTKYLPVVVEALREKWKA